MTIRTKEALEDLSVGIEQLLECLGKERELQTDYLRLHLAKAAKELRTALLSEPAA